jgi:hypothetical protein
MTQEQKIEVLRKKYEAEVRTFSALGGGDRTEDMGIEQHFAIAQARRRIEGIRKEIRNLLEETT